MFVPAPPLYMNNELFVSLYNSLLRKLAFDRSDTATRRSIHIIQAALNKETAPMILVQAVSRNSAMYDGFYPLDEDSYRKALPWLGVIRFNQLNMFGNNVENRMKRLFYGGIDRRDDVCCFYGSLTLPAPPDTHEDELRWLITFMDTFALCLNIQLKPIRLDWHKPDKH